MLTRLIDHPRTEWVFAQQQRSEAQGVDPAETLDRKVSSPIVPNHSPICNQFFLHKYPLDLKYFKLLP